MKEFQANQPIVIDNGSGCIKAGFAGEDKPRIIFPSIIGHPKHTRVMAGAIEDNKFIGNKAQELRGLLKLHYPLEHGIVNDWNEMEEIWQYLYTEELKIPSEEYPLLLTEAALNPQTNREKLAQVMFETFNVPALFISIQAVLALYASGRTTGIVLDSGDGVTHSIPIFEGFSMQNAIKRNNVAGRDITEYLTILLRKSGYAFYTSAEKEIVRQIKEKCCYLSQSTTREERESMGKSQEYQLPDGQTIKLGFERFRAPEILFRPEIIGEEYHGIHDLFNDSISKVDLDLRKDLWCNIVLSGGTTLTRGFGDRLLYELKKLAPRDAKIRIFAPPERKYSTWIGGSILASLSTFRKMWVTAEQYKENPDIIHKKFF